MSILACAPLAQITGDPAPQVAGPLILLGIGILILVGAALAILAVRRRWLNNLPDAQPEWSLEDLRRLHAKGQLSDEEFQRLKEVAMTSIAATLDGPGRGSSPSRGSAKR